MKIFNVFGGKESGSSGAYYRNRKREAKDFEKVHPCPPLTESSMSVAQALLTPKIRSPYSTLKAFVCLFVLYVHISLHSTLRRMPYG